MANNRIWMKCKECDDQLFLGKSFGEGYYWARYNDSTLEARLNAFYEKHAGCGENCFEITYDEVKA